MTIRSRPIKALAILFLLVHASPSGAEAVKPDDIVGVWVIEDDGVAVEKIEIYRCEEKYCGKIVWLKSQEESDTPVTDIKNGSKELRNRPLLNLEVLRDYEFDGQSTWKGGKFYAHRKGKTVSPKLTLINGDELKIQVKILFVKKSFVWKRDRNSSPKPG